MAMKRRRGDPRWVSLPDEKLLDLRLCDLGVKIEGTVVEERVARLHSELEDRGIRHRPHVWLSSEWFSPDGIPGIAIPFYLAHRRLMRLEKKMMFEVEGGSERDCMKILRHEAGHCVSTAYRLHRKQAWRKTFGPVSKRYPDSYKPKPFSRDFVQHLPGWYAQAHPAEDFAETFAVWLAPGKRWRRRYKDWPVARKKLEFVDALMKSVRDAPPPVRSRRHIEPLRELKSTLRAHYKKKQARHGVDTPDFYDRDLRRLFPADPDGLSWETAAKFLRRRRAEIREAVAEWTGEYRYTIDLVLKDMIERCQELKLRRSRPEHEVKTHAMLLVAVQTMNYLHSGHHRIAL